MRSFLAALCFAGSLSAGPVIWNLNNVQLADGTSITGSFTVDADTNIFSNLSITTSGGSSLPSNNAWVFYSGPPFGGWLNTTTTAGILVVDSTSPDLTNASWMTLETVAPATFTDAGGILQIGQANGGICTNSTCTTGPPIVNTGSGQFVSAVGSTPEPASLLLAGSALVWLALRRKKL